MCAADGRNEALADLESSKPLFAAILAGGVGTRLWPRSRRLRPKQFSDLTGSGYSLIQATAERLSGVIPHERLLVATGSQYASLVMEQLPYLSEQQLILEPAGRNTAPAIGLAAFRAHRLNPDAILALLHSDHIIPDEEAFRIALRCAANTAIHGHIVTLGIQPTSAHTGYGYIKRGAELNAPDSDCPLPVYSVGEFLEKPELEIAKQFLASGVHYWNAGIFVARVDRLLSEFEQQLPELFSILQQIDDLEASDLPSDEVSKAFEELWHAVSPISFDHGIMEHANRVAVVPLDAGWNDVGSWEALEDVLPIGDDENLVLRGKVVSIDSHNNIVSSDGPLVALIGIEDLVIIDTGDALLIGRKDGMQRVREVVDRLASEDDDGLL
jgi:mannose-1-phosphate guanylyltransferase